MQVAVQLSAFDEQRARGVAAMQNEYRTTMEKQVAFGM